ncbi:MAG: hypothetical protein IPK19_35310 [Chloroflexi bacterium]|nr:hypothetical protein [Chloroflexota bacterium]
MGDFRLDLATWENPPTAQVAEWFPLESAAVEPGQIYAAAPLYALARAVPGIGLAHTVWLLNALVTAAAGVVLYAFARALDASPAASLMAAVAFGVSTAVVPYSKTLFRESLTLLLLLCTAYAAHRLARSRYRSLGWVVLLALAAAALLLTRASAVFAVPALLILLIPPGDTPGASPRLTDRSALRRIGLGALVVAMALGLLVAGLTLAGDRLGLGARYNVAARLLAASTDTLPVALHTYLLSVGGSIWGTSPALLLAIPGAWLLLRHGRLRLVLAALLAVLGFAFGYAIFNGDFWFGGLAWPPRFLIPVIPLALLPALPVFERAARRPVSGWGALVAAVVLYGIWINITAVSLPLPSYSAALPPASRGLASGCGVSYGHGTPASAGPPGSAAGAGRRLAVADCTWTVAALRARSTLPTGQRRARCPAAHSGSGDDPRRHDPAEQPALCAVFSESGQALRGRPRGGA